MSDLTPEKIAELQRLLDAATARPWMVDDEGDDVVVIVDEGNEFSFIQIAADLHQGDDGLTDARLIVAAVNALPALLRAAAERDALRAKLDAVRTLHRPVGIYDECECPDEAKGVGHEDVDEVGLTCNRIYTVCAECCRDDVYQTEDCAVYHDHDPDEAHHCPTIRALDGDADQDAQKRP